MAAEDLLNLTGLTYFKGLCDTKYSNKIESVSVNDIALTPDAQKAVYVYVPSFGISQEKSMVYWTESSESGTSYSASLTVDAGGTGASLVMDGASGVDLASKSYVDTNGGKIDKIKVNGTEQTITNKEVNLAVVEAKGTYNEGVLTQLELIQHSEGVCFIPESYGAQMLLYNEGSTVMETVVNKNYVDSTFRTEAQVQTAIDNALADITGVEFRLVDALPATGESGIFYLKGPVGTGTNVYEEWIWLNSGTDAEPNWHWENIGTTAIDLSGYVQKSDINIITTAQIDALFAA